MLAAQTVRMAAYSRVTVPYSSRQICADTTKANNALRPSSLLCVRLTLCCGFLCGLRIGRESKNGGGVELLPRLQNHRWILRVVGTVGHVLRLEGGSEICVWGCGCGWVSRRVRDSIRTPSGSAHTRKSAGPINC